MGIGTPCRAQEKDVAPQKAPTIPGWKGSKGRHSSEQVPGVWKRETIPSFVPVLCQRYDPTFPIEKIDAKIS